MQTMYQATFTPAQGWSGQLQPYGPLQLHPSAQVLNYGQSVFEGMKAQRTAGGNIVLFRPDENAARMMAGAIPGIRASYVSMKLQQASGSPFQPVRHVSMGGKQLVRLQAPRDSACHLLRRRCS